MSNFDTIKKGDEIYPDDTTKIKELENIINIPNFYDIFFKWKSPLFAKRFMSLMEKTAFASFFEGLKYEYGLNSHPMNLQRAFEIYKKGSQGGEDVMSMIRMYYIYVRDFQKFGQKKDKIFEHFFLFKAYAFSPFEVYERFSELSNRFDLALFVNLYILNEDENLSKFYRLCELLEEKHNILSIPLSDIQLIKSLICLRFSRSSLILSRAEKVLLDLAEKGNLEAIYKYAFFNYERSPVKCEELIQKLIQKKYKKAYEDIAKYYYDKKKDFKTSEKYFRLALSLGYVRSAYYINDVILNDSDYCEFKIDSTFIARTKELISNLIDDIAIDSVYSIFELLYMRKILVKHFKLIHIFKDYIHYIKDIYTFLYEITKEKNRDDIKKIFIVPRFAPEFYLALGAMQYYGIEGVVEKNYQESIKNLNMSLSKIKSISYKRFVMQIRNKVYTKLYKDNKLSKEALDKDNKELFNTFYNSLKEEKLSNLSSSFMYFFSRLYKKEIGTSKNELMCLICLKHATESRMENPGIGSFVSYYRKYKAKKIFKEQNLENKLKECISKIVPKSDEEGYGEGASLCPICFSNPRNKIVLPCLHRYCRYCVEKLRTNELRCAICRGLIFDVIDISNNIK